MALGKSLFSLINSLGLDLKSKDMRCHFQAGCLNCLIATCIMVTALHDGYMCLFFYELKIFSRISLFH